MSLPILRTGLACALVHVTGLGCPASHCQGQVEDDLRHPGRPRSLKSSRSAAYAGAPGARGRSFDHPAKLASNRVPKESAWVQVTPGLPHWLRWEGSRILQLATAGSDLLVTERCRGEQPPGRVVAGEERLKWCAAWQQRAVRRPARRTRRWWRGPGGDQRSVQLGAAQDVQDPLGWAVQALTGASLTHPTATPSALRPPARAGCRPDLGPSPPARVRQGGQASHDRRAAWPIHGPGTFRPTLPADSQMTEPLTTR